MAVLGIFGAVGLALIAPIYLWRTIHGDIQPHPLSWAVWSAIGVVGFSVSIVAHSGAGAIVLGVAAALEIATFLTSLNKWSAQLSMWEFVPLVPVVIGISLWLFADNLTLAAIGVASADCFGLFPTAKKTWSTPTSEPPWLWFAGGVAFSFGCLSIATPSPSSLIYPCYLAVSSFLIALIGWMRSSDAVNRVARGH